MAATKKFNTQINLSIPTEWKEELEQLARIYSVEERRNVSVLELIRTAIQEKYQLGSKDEQ